MDRQKIVGWVLVLGSSANLGYMFRERLMVEGYAAAREFLRRAA